MLSRLRKLRQIGLLHLIEEKLHSGSNSGVSMQNRNQQKPQTEIDSGNKNGIFPQLFDKAYSWSNQFQGFIEDMVPMGNGKTVKSPSQLEASQSNSQGNKPPAHHISGDPASVRENVNINITSIGPTSPKEKVNINITSTGPTSPKEKVNINVDSTVSSAGSEGTLTSFSLTEVSQSIWNVPIIKSIYSRVQTTLRGSADDIGWLLRSPGMPSTKDGTERFDELVKKIRNGEKMLPDTYVYLLIPGLFSNHGPLYFVDTKKFFSKLGLTCDIAKIHSEASVETNAKELKQYIEELYWGSGKRVMLLGHSKGGVDAAAALSLYWPDLEEKVAGLALVQSPYGGSPIASDILRKGQIADNEARHIMELVICKMIKGDMRALEDLTYEKRREFILKHPLPTNLPLVSFHTEASITPGVVATMSHVAHAELPRLSIPGGMFGTENRVSEGTKVPVSIPIAAAMAMCALQLQIRYGAKSDGLVTRADAEVPGSVVVRPKNKLDHAWIVYTSTRKGSDDPDSSHICYALLALLVEIGRQKRADGSA